MSSFVDLCECNFTPFEEIGDDERLIQFQLVKYNKEVYDLFRYSKPVMLEETFFSIQTSNNYCTDNIRYYAFMTYVDVEKENFKVIIRGIMIDIFEYFHVNFICTFSLAPKIDNSGVKSLSVIVYIQECDDVLIDIGDGKQVFEKYRRKLTKLVQFMDSLCLKIDVHKFKSIKDYLELLIEYVSVEKVLFSLRFLNVLYFYGMLLNDIQTKINNACTCNCDNEETYCKCPRVFYICNEILKNIYFL